MTISDTLEGLPGVKKVLVDVVDHRLRLRISVAPQSPAESVLMSCDVPMIDTSLAEGLPDGNWFCLSVMSNSAIERLNALRAQTPVERETEKAHE